MMQLSTILGLLLAMGLPTLFAFLKHADKSAPVNRARHLSTMWGICLAVLAWVWWLEGRTVASIGIVWGNYLAWLLGALLGAGLLGMSVGAIIQSGKEGQGGLPEGSEDGLRRLLSTPRWFRWAGVLTAGITEEILFRGYPIERLLEMTGNIWLAALIPLAVFTLGHLGGWSLGHLTGVLLAGALLTGLYLWQRDLIACMIAHLVTDSLLLFLPSLLKKLTARQQCLERSLSTDR